MSETTPLINTSVPAKKSHKNVIIGCVVVAAVAIGGFITYTKLSKSVPEAGKVEGFPEADAELFNFKLSRNKIDPVEHVAFDCKGFGACNATVRFSDVSEIQMDYLIQSNDEHCMEYTDVWSSLDSNIYTVHVHTPKQRPTHPRDLKFQVLIHLNVPKSLEFDFDIDADVGLLDFVGTPKKISAMTSHIHAGIIKVKDVKSDTFDFQMNAGVMTVQDIKAVDLVKADTNAAVVEFDVEFVENGERKVDLYADAGVIVGKYENYASFTAKVEAGVHSFDLVPLPESFTKVTGEAAEIDLALTDFEGSVDLKATVGTVKLKYSTPKKVNLKKKKAFPGEHYVGTIGEGKMQLQSVVTAGTIKATFE
ncbi:hypothetical protein HK103_000843 [Boothiomyces macroporosus]|uniref:Adhesin domain-containing protein n=1 Tax=Boothiomyces macroporosus TaxID=261099 RepID=A0AAD5Y5M6_9FUNG|nr:hypothetical protein HK103_000843 [Boothiomyces macroporosus]